MKIQSIRVIRKSDPCPDTSYLGEYSNNPSKVCIDRKERGDMLRNEFRYFNSAGELEFVEQDYARMEALQKQEWGFQGIYAEATIVIGNTFQTIESGGLWGIESDSDEDYWKEEAKNQYIELRDILEEMGFNSQQITGHWNGEIKDK